MCLRLLVAGWCEYATLLCASQGNQTHVSERTTSCLSFFIFHYHYAYKKGCIVCLLMSPLSGEKTAITSHATSKGEWLLLFIRSRITCDGVAHSVISLSINEFNRQFSSDVISCLLLFPRRNSPLRFMDITHKWRCAIQRGKWGYCRGHHLAGVALRQNRTESTLSFFKI